MKNVSPPGKPRSRGGEITAAKLASCTELTDLASVLLPSIFPRTTVLGGSIIAGS
jgi:hypothetical protein